MTNEHLNPTTQNIDPNLQGEISLEGDIAMLRQNPALGSEDLFSSNKMQSSEYPDKPGVRVALGTPIETAVSDRSDVQQDLMAVVALGKGIALGVVRGKDQSGSEVSYLSLLNNNPSENEGRARFVDVLAEGTPITIGRDKLEQTVGREGTVPGVSGTHCTVELLDGVLTVVDETSTNGTTLFTNSTNDRVRQFNGIQTWSQPSGETKKLIETEQEAERLSKVSKLGRFTVDNG
jgi:hypothetical protein